MNLDVEHPTLLETLSSVPIKQIACGYAFTAAVSKDGKLYTWGAGGNGRLGHGDTVTRLVPEMVESIAQHHLIGVHAGSVHCCVLSQEGLLFSFGKSEYNGHGRRHDDVSSPLLLNFSEDEPIHSFSIGPGGFHTIALTRSGKVFTWGHNRVGQLGFMNTDDMPRNMDGAQYMPSPRQVVNLPPDPIIQVAAGWGHSAILTDRGQVYVCGRNVENQLGLGDDSSVLSTLKLNEKNHYYQPIFTHVSSGAIDYKRVIQVACGGEHTIMLTTDNELYGMGLNNHNQLTSYETRNYPIPTLLSSFTLENDHNPFHIYNISCGYHCTMVAKGSASIRSLSKICADIIVKDDTIRIGLGYGIPGIHDNDDKYNNNSSSNNNNNGNNNDNNNGQEGSHEESQCNLLSNFEFEVVDGQGEDGDSHHNLLSFNDPHKLDVVYRDHIISLLDNVFKKPSYYNGYGNDNYNNDNDNNNSI
eukprot:gene7197-9819_t